VIKLIDKNQCLNYEITISYILSEFTYPYQRFNNWNISKQTIDKQSINPNFNKIPNYIRYLWIK